MILSGETAAASVLIIPAIAAGLLAIVSSYRLGAAINVLATALTLAAACSTDQSVTNAVATKASTQSCLNMRETFRWMSLNSRCRHCCYLNVSLHQQDAPNGDL